MAGARKPLPPASTSPGEFARDAREMSEGRRKKRKPRQSGGAKTYIEAEAKERVGDHAITPELVRGKDVPVRRSVSVAAHNGPAAGPIIADLLTVLWAEIRNLRTHQESTGEALNDGQFERLRDLADSTTKVLREERRQNELDDWSRLTTAEILETLPAPYQEALAGLLPGAEPEE